MRENESARERAVSPRALELARKRIVESGTGCKATTMTTGNGIAWRSLCSQSGTRGKESRRWMTDSFAEKEKERERDRTNGRNFVVCIYSIPEFD